MAKKLSYTVPGIYRNHDKIIFVTEDRLHEGTQLLVIDPKTGETLSKHLMSPSEGGKSALVQAELPARNAPLAYLYLKGEKRVVDPYARLVKDGLCYAPDDLTDSDAPDEIIVRPDDLIIYKLHVRGLTMGQAGTKDPGTFAALTDRLPSIRELGFTAIELMPAYAWDAALKDSNRLNYWGYAEKNSYFSPNPRFAASDDPIAEFSSVVKTAHALGLAVIMEFYFPPETDPFVGWQALRYWKETFRIDGFHLMGTGMPHDLILSDPYLADEILVFDGSSEKLIARFRDKAPTGVYYENDDFRLTARAALRGDDSQMSPFVHKTIRFPALWTPVNDIANVNGFTLMDTVSYNYKHNEENGEGNLDGSDNNLSWNCGAEGPVKTRRIIELRQRQIRNALAYVFLSQGVPLLYAGDESGNSQNGNNNAYSLDSPTGWVDSGDNVGVRRLRSYTADLIDFRKRHKILHSGESLKELSLRATGYPEVSIHGDKAWYYDFGATRHAVGILYDGRQTDGCFLYVLYNTGSEAEALALPPMPDGYTWQLILDTSRKSGAVFPDSPEAVESTRFYEMPERSVAVLKAIPSD